MSQRLGFHLQIDFRIDVSRLERNMPEPGANRVDIHSCPKQMCRSRMTDCMRTDALVCQRGNGFRQPLRIALNHCVNAKTRYRLAATIEENSFSSLAAAD